MPTTRHKETYCHTCKREFHYLGISKPQIEKGNCWITFTNGDTYAYHYSRD